MAVLMTYFRNLYDDEHKTNKRQIAECFISGGITLSITTVLDIFGIPSTASVCIGGAVGLLGVDHIRKLMRSYINSRIKKGREEDDDV